MRWPIYPLIFILLFLGYHHQSYLLMNLALITFDVFHLRKTMIQSEWGTLYVGVERDMPIKVVLRCHLILHV